MKKSLLLMALVAVAWSVQAQENPSKELFPDLAKDEARIKAQQDKQNRPRKEATASEQELFSMLFPGSKVPGNTAAVSRSAAPAAKTQNQKLPSDVKAADAANQNKGKHDELLKKLTPPPNTQGEEKSSPANSPAPKNQPAKLPKQASNPKPNNF
jgi:hypothetical protein